MDELQLYETVRLHNMKPADGPVDPKRMLRAKEFAARIMLVVGPYCQQKIEAQDALIAAAYISDAILTTDGERSEPR